LTVWLYIKQHNKTGLRYFGKRTCELKEEVLIYNGSGKYWARHLEEHGNAITTLWCAPFVDRSDLIEFATFFSEFYNIVDATVDGKKLWANLIPENGLDGAPKGCKMPSTSISNILNKKGKPSPLKGVPTGKPNLGVAKANKLRTGMPSSRKGKPNGLEGKTYIKKVCPHCNIAGGGSNMNRYHFNKCKEKQSA
jgi:hypothetical protein